MLRIFFGLSKTISFFYLSLFLGLTACNYTKIKIPRTTDNNKFETIKLSKSTSLSWALINGNILSSCLNCHRNHTKPDLNQWESVRQNLPKILRDIRSNDMPPAKDGYIPLDDCRKAILEAWAEQNAPETSNFKISSLKACNHLPDDATDTPEDPPLNQAPLNYQTLLRRILQPKCIKCHNADSEDLEAAGVLFAPYSEILSREQLWEGPGSTNKLVQTLITEDEDKKMPPTTSDTQALTTDEIQYIIRWIDAGKPN